MRSDTILDPFTIPKVPVYAQQRFHDHYMKADRVMLILIGIQWIVATFFTSIHYNTYIYGFVSGGLIMLVLLVAYHNFRGTQFLRVLMGIAMMLFSLIYIQQYLGRIEMHFHVFIAMAVLSLYKDMTPIYVAAITTILHHIIFNYLQLYEVSLFNMPVMIFNYGCGFDIVILHAIFVIIEAVVIGYIIRLNIEDAVDLNRSENEIRELNKELSFRSRHDPLTGLPNRNDLEAQLRLALAIANRNKERFAVLFLDLDHFKNINDTLGHEIGDILLKTAARRFRSALRENDILARIGGDEFIIVLSDVKDDYSLEKVIIKIFDLFRYEWKIDAHLLRISTSVGIAIYPDDSTQIDELMRFADIAMYKAKSEGRNQYSFFTNTLNQKVHEEVEIAKDMYHALEKDEFLLYLQPKIEISSGRIIGAEALIRWHHGEKGEIYPDQFIPTAEQNGFIVQLGAWVIEETARILSRMQKRGFGDVHVSCNVSARQFHDPALLKTIKEAIEMEQIDPTLFACEITESAVMDSLDKTIKTLIDIKQLGVHICMDDFGTGYSSLSYLRKLPVDTLKIDKSFIDEIKDEADDEAPLINTIIAMCKTLGLSVVAEGVEEAYQIDYLKSKGCDIYQGYYFSKPVSEEVFLELLARHTSDT